jgi:hypothetical protein
MHDQPTTSIGPLPNSPDHRNEPRGDTQRGKHEPWSLPKDAHRPTPRTTARATLLIRPHGVRRLNRHNFKKFRAMGAQKPRLVLQLMSSLPISGVVLSDVDVVWLRRPHRFFEDYPLADVMITTDCLSHKVPLPGRHARTPPPQHTHIPPSFYSGRKNDMVIPEYQPRVAELLQSCSNDLCALISLSKAACTI